MQVGIYRNDGPLKKLSKERILAYTRVAERYNIRLIFFEDKDVNIEENSIKIKQEINGCWVNKQWDIPQIIINESDTTLDTVTDIGKELRKLDGFQNNAISSFPRIKKRMIDDNEFIEYFEDSSINTEYEFNLHLQRYSTGEWKIQEIKVLNLIENRKIDFISFLVEKFKEKKDFYRFYIEELSIDIANYIESFHKRRNDEYVISFGMTQNLKLNLINIKGYSDSVENEVKRAETILNYSIDKVIEKEVNQKITMGMLVKNYKNPSIFKKYNNMKFACASVAKIRNIEFFFFTSEDINYKEKKINGVIYNKNGKKTKKTFEYPDVIVDRLRMRGEKGFQKLYEEFSHIPFNNEREGGAISKSTTYDIISESNIFKEFLIPYRDVDDIYDILEFLEIYSKVILKPSVGSFGDDIIYIEKKANNSFYVVLDDVKKIKTLDELTLFLKPYDEVPMVVQQFILSKTRVGAPFDIRIHVLKDSKGEWNIANIYPRIGGVEGITSNLSNGGSTSTWAAFFKNEFPEYEWKDFNKELMNFSISFSNFFQGKLDRNINEIAIDIGIDRPTMQIVFFEINVNIPGCRFHTLEAAFYIVSYAEYLAKKDRKKRLERFFYSKNFNSKIEDKNYNHIDV